MADGFTIQNWAEDDRPREKLVRLGAQSLSNAELLAILIGSGSADESAVDLMKRLMSDCRNNLNTLGKLTVSDLETYKGIGPAKAITILAACELGKRRQASAVEERPKLDEPHKIYDFMHPRMQDLDVEEAWAIFLNQNYKLIDAKCISHGGITETAVDIRVIMREALQRNATILAFCHNHPSNNNAPSAMDDRLTRQISQACDTLRIYFVDHVIVTDGAYYSYREDGRL